MFASLLCRITPDGGQPASGSSPTAAWEQLDKSAASGATADTTAAAARAVGTCGAKLFGLQHPVVQALVQALPNAAACDKFVAWQGERPPPVQLVSRLATIASHQHIMCACFPLCYASVSVLLQQQGPARLSFSRLLLLSSGSHVDNGDR